MNPVDENKEAQTTQIIIHLFWSSQTDPYKMRTNSERDGSMHAVFRQFWDDNGGMGFNCL